MIPTSVLHSDPSNWLRICPVHKCKRTECNTKHYNEVVIPIEVSDKYHLCFKNALGYFIYTSGISITTIQQSCGWTRQNINSLFHKGEHSMTLRSVYKVCKAINIEMADVFELTNEYMRLFEGEE